MTAGEKLVKRLEAAGLRATERVTYWRVDDPQGPGLTLATVHFDTKCRVMIREELGPVFPFELGETWTKNDGAMYRRFYVRRDSEDTVFDVIMMTAYSRRVSYRARNLSGRAA